MQGAGRGAPIRVVERYALFEQIAAGGMAVVHLGRLIGAVGFARTVAIKRLHPHLAEDSRLVDMFVDEARVASRIRHPNVVAPTDVISADDEVLLVMEYVHGESLAHLFRAAGKAGERIPVEIIAPIMAGVLHGLHSAHEARDEQGRPLDIVHRDVSPQNVLVGVDGVPRVVDFGVAKAMGRLQKTQPGELKGKLAYMPPEQLADRGTDRRTDVYACGVVLWEALVGKRMFAGETDAAVVSRILSASIDAPSTRAPGVSAALDAIVLRCLERDPAERFASARDVACALEQAVSFAPASAIGAWVERLAGEALAQRAALISDIERASTDASSAPPPGAAQTARDALPSQLPTRIGLGPAPLSREAVTLTDAGWAGGAGATESMRRPALDETATPILLRSDTRAAPGSLPMKVRARTVAALGGGAVALVLLIAGLSRRGGAAASSAQTVAPTVAAIEALTIAASSAASSGAPTIAAPSVNIEGPEEVSGPLAPAAAEPSGVAAQATSPPAQNVAARPARTRAPVSRCTPPYTFDASGTKRYKIGCL